MARRKATIDDKIAQAESVVIKTKEKYDAALENLNRLIKKKRELEGKELMQAYEKSNRSLEEVLEFLSGSSEDDEE
ncbi:ErpK protein [Butyrivibrio fibrisolvens]|jgi:recombinational DNA repair ATPase RecF|uniref:ErpK protein n=1 Tax=Butyrivibrio fibrisolvens TaxID=831 RepID=A0A317FX14_BUTFI|nr:ErpK protein [Butyrivibrio fibrisolvens]PWT25656.1 ErpK protein [Butyrivibrio fibrisolvens]